MALAMSLPRRLARFVAAASFGGTLVAACAGAAPAAMGPQDGWTPDADAIAAKKGAEKAPDAGPPPSDAGAPRCPYGELNDPHRGFVRCLLPDERAPGWRAPPAPSASPDPKPPEPPKEPDKPAEPPPIVEIGAPKFENGEVTKVAKSLGKAKAGIAACVAEHGGLSAATGSLKVQFLVRSRGRAEGVEVLSAKGVSREASSCVRVLLKNKAIGAPSADPVGVTVVITLKPAK
jgi:hypothetical protein